MNRITTMNRVTMIEITMQNYAAFSGKPTSTYQKTFDVLPEAARWFAAGCGLATPVRVTVDGQIAAEGSEACLVYLESLSREEVAPEDGNHA